MDPVVQVFEASNLEEFGFVVFRMDFGSDAEWNRWLEAMNGPLDESIANTAGGEKIKDKVVTPLVDDIDLQGKGWRVICDYYEELFVDEVVPPGANGCVALAVDKDAMDSLLSPQPGQKPWVWAVDSGFTFEPDQPAPPPKHEPPTDKYPGYFRVSPDSVLTDLWPILRTPWLSPIHGIGLIPSAEFFWRPDKRIWDSRI